ncbi:MAG TPA: hypothetical protein VFP34_18840 [Microlunatus sp.]|nr:hypothetical protein [Microlunatus sp.]
MNVFLDFGSSLEHNLLLRQWWLRNGLLPAELSGPVRVDLDARTITYRRLADDPQPGEPHFPELPRDTDNQPLTTECVVPLRVDPPSSLLPSHREPRVA